MPQALIIDDDQAFTLAVAEFIEQQGFTVAVAETLRKGRTLLHRSTPDVLLIDLLLPDGSGLDLIREIDPASATRIVVITGHASLDAAIESLRAKVFDFLVKPVDIARLKRCLQTATSTPAEPVSRCTDAPGELNKLVGDSDAMQQLSRMLVKVAPSEATVLLQGESGTSKDLIARLIHQSSLRHDKPYLAINCGAISPQLIGSELFGHERGSFTGAHRQHKGHFERASGGTLFLDEITEMPLELQVQLLRVLEEGTLMRIGGDQTIVVDVRLIAATNRNPEQAIREGKLREDLYFRFSVFPIRVPALRERGAGDIKRLTEHFLATLNHRYGTDKRLTPAALGWLERNDWPGNVRQLGNAVQRGFILAETEIDATHLTSFALFDSSDPDDPLHLRVGTPIEDAERRLILTTLDHYQGDKPRTAEVLGISLKTLYNRLKHYQENGLR